MNKESHENQFNIKLQSLFFQERNGPSSLRGRLKMGEDHRYQVVSDDIKHPILSDIRLYQMSDCMNIRLYQISDRNKYLIVSDIRL